MNKIDRNFTILSKLASSLFVDHQNTNVNEHGFSLSVLQLTAHEFETCYIFAKGYMLGVSIFPCSTKDANYLQIVFEHKE